MYFSSSTYKAVLNAKSVVWVLESPDEGECWSTQLRYSKGCLSVHTQEYFTLHLEAAGHKIQPPLLQFWDFFYRESKADSC